MLGGVIDHDGSRFRWCCRATTDRSTARRRVNRVPSPYVSFLQPPFDWRLAELRLPEEPTAALSTDEESPTRSMRGRTQTTRQRLGIAHPDRARRRATGQRRTGQQPHRYPAFRLTAHRAIPPRPRLYKARP